MSEQAWWQWIDSKLAMSKLWDEHGLMLSARAVSLFSLPIEGGFWTLVMGSGWFATISAYALPFTMDLISDQIVYKYGRIQQTVVKGRKKWRASRRLLFFVVFNACASWGTAAWQLYSQMQPVQITFPILFAVIQPLMGAGAAWTMAVEHGKYVDSDKDVSEQPKLTRVQGAPDVEWWRDKVASLNGGAEQLTVNDVRELVLAEYTDLPSPTTLYNWKNQANKAREDGD